jgi:D-glycero-D-manno-heptose 1,7-bisphosphate phosphatase
VVGQRRAVFLDRDGVINKSLVIDGKPVAPATIDQFEILPGVPAAIARLKDAGLTVIVATNQPDVARGTHRRSDVEAMHNQLKDRLKVDDIYACYCLEGPGCDCYKPKPGMLLEAARKWGIDLARSFMIGDRWRDVGAGKAAGCRTFFIDYGYRERRPDNPDYVVKDLAEAVGIILDRIDQD